MSRREFSLVLKALSLAVGREFAISRPAGFSAAPACKDSEVCDCHSLQLTKGRFLSYRDWRDRASSVRMREGEELVMSEEEEEDVDAQCCQAGASERLQQSTAKDRTGSPTNDQPVLGRLGLKGSNECFPVLAADEKLGRPATPNLRLEFLHHPFYHPSIADRHDPEIVPALPFVWPKLDGSAWRRGQALLDVIGNACPER